MGNHGLFSGEFPPLACHGNRSSWGQLRGLPHPCRPRLDLRLELGTGGWAEEWTQVGEAAWQRPLWDSGSENPGGSPSALL